MSLIEQAEQLLAHGEPLTTAEIVNRLPALADGEEMLRLLLRLNRRVKALADGRWVLALQRPTPETRIVAATRAYFERQPVPGDLIGKLVQAVVEETGYAEALVRATILDNFQNNAGRFVVNRLKERS